MPTSPKMRAALAKSMSQKGLNNNAFDKYNDGGGANMQRQIAAGMGASAPGMARSVDAGQRQPQLGPIQQATPLGQRGPFAEAARSSQMPAPAAGAPRMAPAGGSLAQMAAQQAAQQRATRLPAATGGSTMGAFNAPGGGGGISPQGRMTQGVAMQGTSTIGDVGGALQAALAANAGGGLMQAGAGMPTGNISVDPTLLLPPPPGAGMPVRPPGSVSRESDLFDPNAPPPPPRQTILPPGVRPATEVLYPGGAAGGGQGAAGGAGTASADDRPTEFIVEDMIRDLLTRGQRDTTEEEANARAMIEDRSNQAVVDSRARAGRFGMVSSGAQAGIEANEQRRAAQEALQAIYGIRNDARGEEMDFIRTGGALHGQEAARALEQSRLDLALGALEAFLGGDGGGTDPGNYAGVTTANGSDVTTAAPGFMGNGQWDNDGDGVADIQVGAAEVVKTAGGDLQVASQPPPNSSREGPFRDADGRGYYRYTDQNGKQWAVLL